jgi:hypothetical protein
MSPARVNAELFQTIHVNVMSETKAEVQRVPVNLAELPASIRSHVEGSDRIRIVLVIWLPTTKTQEKKIMDLCRAAGATSFTIAFKS